MQLKSFKKKLIIKKFIVSLINLINTFVLCCLVTIRPITVLADNDDQWIYINDFEMWNAYRYWSYYGLSANTTTTYSQVLNSITESESTGTFTFSGQFSGSLAASVDLTYTGEIGDPDLGIASIIGTETGHIGGGSTNVSMTITPNGSGAEGNQPVTYACTYNAQSTASNALMTCRPDRTSYSTTFTLPNESITFDQLDIFTNTQSTYLVKMLNEGVESGTIGGSLSLSGSGSGNLSINSEGAISTTVVDTNNLRWTFPYMTGTINNGISGHPNVMKRFQSRPDNEFTIIFLSPYNYEGMSSWTTIVNSSGDQVQYTTKNTVYQNRGGMRLFACTFHINGTGYYFLQFNRELRLVPLFVGYFDNIPDDIYRFVYGSDRIIEILNKGTTKSQNSETNLNDKKTGFDGTSGQLISIEESTGNNLDTAINNVNMDTSLFNNSKFLNAANWVYIRFRDIYLYNPWENYLTFCLCLGFALLIIGKVR